MYFRKNGGAYLISRIVKSEIQGAEKQFTIILIDTFGERQEFFYETQEKRDAVFDFVMNQAVHHGEMFLEE